MSVTGTDSLLGALHRGGVDLCFANPGTSELELVRAAGRLTRFRPILCLFEGVLAGAADGYARMSGTPAATLTHLGPGFADGIANFHNARRARSPVINLIGQNSLEHSRLYDVGLNTDIASLTRPVSDFFAVAQDPASLEALALRALEAATASGGGVATLAVPSDVQRARVVGPGKAHPGKHFVRNYLPVDTTALREVARAINVAQRVTLLIGANASGAASQSAAAAIARDFPNVRLFLDTFGARVERGGGLPAIGKLPYFSEAALNALAGSERVVLVGADAPVTFFERPGLPNEFAPPESLMTLATPAQDAEQAMIELAEQLGATHLPRALRCTDELPGYNRTDALTAAAVGNILAAHLPPRAIVSVESPVCGPAFGKAQLLAERHTALALTGGAIGQGIPVALGAALACPDRSIYALESDGSAAYTPQSLWTIARENLPITVIIAANRRYDILDIELQRLGAQELSGLARSLTDMGSPTIDWTEVASGFGVEACTAWTCGELAQALAGRARARTPLLIQANI